MIVRERIVAVEKPYLERRDLLENGGRGRAGKKYLRDDISLEGLSYIQSFSPSEKDHKVRTKVIQVDFSGGHEIYEAVGKELEGLEIGVLGQ